MNRFPCFAAIALLLSGCVAGTEESGPQDTEESDSLAAEITLRPGVNGGACALSDYNCKFRVDGGNRIAHTDGSIDWGIDGGATILDGNGDSLGVEGASTLKFNFGQERVFGGKHYVYALTTSNHSSGWFPLSSVKSADVLGPRVGHVSAHRSGLAKMACYQIKDSADPKLAEKKVVHDTTAAPGPAGEAAGDYLPRLRANNKRSINLIFNTPGSGLGGPAIDHFPTGTKFQRLDVPTDTGHPSIDVKLWSQDGNGKFLTPAGTMKFVYGSIQSKTGDTRVGWMAYDGLSASSGCP
ncbi:MAG: hypothetical protein ABJE95_00940 [Byssovorax sp.]